MIRTTRYPLNYTYILAMYSTSYKYRYSNKIYKNAIEPLPAVHVIVGIDSLLCLLAAGHDRAHHLLRA
eukprot:COSAG02_NODE_26399_length_634_cov_0.807477_1_plen_67_part_10